MSKFPIFETKVNPKWLKFLESIESA